MSDSFNGDWENAVENAIQAGSFLPNPPIDNYVYDYTDNFEIAWDAAPLGDFTDGQIDAFIDILLGLDDDGWDDLMDAINNGEWDFWDWWEENYGGG